MLDDRCYRDATLIFILALATRLVSVAITTVTNLNTYAQADANGFAFTAAYIAGGLRDGIYILPPSYSNTYHIWGTFLSPFWLIPGPSRIYARLGMAVLGAIAVYNVCVIARIHHSKRAGVIAVFPLLIYPSFLFIHAVVLREVMIFFGLTMIARLLLIPSPRIKSTAKYAIVAVLLVMVTLLRQDNLLVYLLVLTVAAIVKIKPWRHYPTTTKIAAGAGAIATPIILPGYSRQVLDRLIDIRESRARGRTEYLGSTLPEAILEAIAFSWIGAIYFLFSPFPWMVSLGIDFVAMLEGLLNLGYSIAAIFGARVFRTRTIAGSTALAVGIVVGSVLYGFGTANVGTAVRHRQMILWAIFLLGGIGIAQHIHMTLDE